MKRVVNHVRRIVITLIGVPLFILGIILIPLPGPGLVVSLIALIVLSFEYEWAQKRRNEAVAELKKLYTKAKERSDAIENYGQKNHKN